MDVKTLVYIFIYSFIVLLNLFPLAPNNFWFYSVRGKPVLVLLSHFNGSPREWRGFDLSSHETGTIINPIDHGKELYFHGLQRAWDIINFGKA